jgi:glycosyltransferase involved in cell wall biosynthesis
LRSDARYAVEVIVVDNASDDDTRQVAQIEENRLGINLRVVNEPQLGISSARNRGIESATGDVIIFIDDDVELPENLIDALRAPIGDGLELRD